LKLFRFLYYNYYVNDIVQVLQETKFYTFCRRHHVCTYSSGSVSNWLIGDFMMVNWWFIAIQEDHYHQDHLHGSYFVYP